MYCARCGGSNSEAMVYCQQCGVSLGSTAPSLALSVTPMRGACPSCRGPAGALRYCTSCGAAKDLVENQSLGSGFDLTHVAQMVNPQRLIQGAIGAGAAVVVVFLAALILRYVMFSGDSPLPVATSSQMEQKSTPFSSTNVGLTYGQLHQAPIVLKASADESGSSSKQSNPFGERSSISVNLHVPVLLGFLIVPVAMFVAGRYASGTKDKDHSLMAALMTGGMIAVPYATVSFLIALFARKTFQEGGARGYWGVGLWATFLYALLFAVFFATLGAYRPGGDRPGAWLTKWRSHAAAALKALAFGCVGTLLIALVVGSFQAKRYQEKPPRQNSFMGLLDVVDLKRNPDANKGLRGAVKYMTPSGMAGLFDQAKPINVITQGIPIQTVQAMAFSHFAPLQAQVPGGPAPTTNPRLFKLPEGSTWAYWLLPFAPILALGWAGHRLAKSTGEPPVGAAISGAIMGAIYAALLALLAAVSQVRVSSVSPFSVEATVGPGFWSTLIFGLLVGCLVGAGSGYLTQYLAIGTPATRRV